MKIAGRKNDGAWYRTNKELAKLDGNDQGALNAVLQLIPTSDAAFNALLALANETGVDGPTFPANKGAWLFRMITEGIPRQIYMGKLTFTTYTEVVGENGPYLLGNYQSEIHHFAKDLRKALANWLFARRQMRDVFDMGSIDKGNPGGNPDNEQDEGKNENYEIAGV